MALQNSRADGGIMAASANVAASTFTTANNASATTTISTIASHGFVELRIDEMRPGLLELGSSTEESRQLLDSHNDLVDRLAGKQPQVEDLLARADQLVSEQKEENDILVYEAMAESLGGAWKELNRQLELRGYVLFDEHHLQQLADEHAERVREINSLLRDAMTMQEQQQEQAGTEPSGRAAPIVASIEKSIDELITVTAVGVDLGSQLISQIRVLGSLADSEGRPQEVANACLHVEKLMLKMAQQWELLDSYWSTERAKLTSSDGDVEERVRAFLATTEVVLDQLHKMREDLLNSRGASMASELGPLANQKAGPLIAEGEGLLAIAGVLRRRTEVATQIDALKSTLRQLVEMARGRIAAAKSGNDRLRENISTLSNWLGGVVEVQLMGPASRIGSSNEESQHFIVENKQLSEDVAGKGPEVLSLFAHASELPAQDRKALAGLQQRYESAREVLEARLQLGRALEQVHKFGRELDTSFDLLASLVHESNSSVATGGDGAMVHQQVRNVFQTVQETLHRERHQGEKFIAAAEQAVRRDSQLAIQAPIDSINSLLAVHERRFAEARALLEEWEQHKAAAAAAIDTNAISPDQVGSVEPGKPVFVQPLRAAGVGEGETAVLDCVVVASPEPIVVWYREESEVLKETDRIQLHFRGDHCSLSILNTSAADSGLYKVCAVNVHGESTSFCRLNVTGSVEGRGSQQQFEEHTEHRADIEASEIAVTDSSASPPPPVPVHRGFEPAQSPTTPPTPEVRQMGDAGYSSLAKAPEFVRAFQAEYEVDEGERVRLDCMMVGNPRPRIQWHFNEQPVVSDYRFVELLNVGDTYSIQMSPAKLEHAGHYRMVAENVRGRCECSTLVHVRPLSMQHEHLPRERAQRQWASVERQQALNDFPHAAPGYPISGEHQSPPSRHPPPTRALSASMHVARGEQPAAQPQPRRASSTAVTSGGDAPHFMHTLVSSVCAIGDEARFEAAVVGWPLPEVEWSKDGVPLGETATALGSPVEFLSGDDGRVALIFRSVQPADGGKFMCTARNASGVATSSAQLVVRARTEAPDFLRRLVSEEVVEGERLQWAVEVSGDPPPTVTWLRDGQPIPNCEEVRLVQYEGKPALHSMIIERVEVGDAGQFTCLLENSAGEARSTADLLVRKSGSEPGNYFHITKVLQEKQLRGEELSRNQTLSVERPPPPSTRDQSQP